MKTYKTIALTLCIALAAASFGCGRQSGDGKDTTDNAAPSEVTQLTTDDAKQPTDGYGVKDAIEEITKIEAAQKNQVSASGQADFDSAIADETSSGVLLRTTEHKTVTVSGSHAGKTVTVDAPSGCVVSESENVSFILEQTGTGGLITDAKAAAVYVKGDNIPLTLKAGADSVLVTGKNCTVTFKSGEYPSVTVLNITAALTNLTQNDINITRANGTILTLPSMQTYNFEDDSFSKAKP